MRISEIKVNQKPGAVLVLAARLIFFTRLLTCAKRAMSMANAISVINAATEDAKNAPRFMVSFSEKDVRNAMKRNAVATA